MNRVTFYSKEDLSVSINLERAELAINSFNKDQVFSINDILELYNINLFFEHDLYLLKWSNKYKANLQEIVNTFDEIVVQFFLTINNSNVVSEFQALEFYYTVSFWKLVEKFSIFKRLSPETFFDVSKCERFYLREILQHKKLVNYFSNEILQIFSSREKSPEIVISYFEEERSSNQPELYFPFKIGDKFVEALIDQYLNSTDPNLNYVRLIVKSRSLRLSDKLKFRAKKLSEEIEQKIFNKGNGISQGITLVVSESQTEPLQITTEENSTIYSYGKTWLDQATEPFAILQNFAGLFSYINNQGCINLVSKRHEVTGFESVFTKSKNEYYTGFAFQHKHLLSQAQIHLYIRYLQLQGFRLEEMLESIVNDFINFNFPISGLRIKLPTEKSTILEKNRMISPELEFLIKQYKSFADDNEIDFELLEFSTSQLHLSEVKSKLNQKYAYPKGEKIQAITFHLFSKNAFLHYIEPYNDKYSCFVNLITNESIKREDFALHNSNIIDFLVLEDCIYFDENDIVMLKNIDLIYIAKIFYEEDVISYYHQNNQIRAELDLLNSKGYIDFENTLFTSAERKYINYHLNKKEFTNSLDLRNKYSHGTNSTSEDEQMKDYGILLKLVVLVICKIVDDLILFERQTGANTR